MEVKKIIKIRKKLNEKQVENLKKARVKLKEEFDVLNEILNPSKQVWKRLRELQEVIFIIDLLIGKDEEEAWKDVELPSFEYRPKEWYVRISRRRRPKPLPMHAVMPARYVEVMRKLNRILREGR